MPPVAGKDKKPVISKTTTPKPKFGEVGFTFPVIAKITQVNSDEDQYGYPFVVNIDMGNFEEFDFDCGIVEIKYGKSADFKEFYAKCDPKFLKTQKQEELKQAQALVAKLTKELTLIK
jgi:hypothetical protein